MEQPPKILLFGDQMPLYEDGPNLVRDNLTKISLGQKVKAVAIGVLTEKQLESLNAARIECELWPMEAEVLFVGNHFYRSRMKQGYTIDDMVKQVESAISIESIMAFDAVATTMQNPNERDDGYGNLVTDKAVFECTQRRPKPELFSVMPKGDKIKPKTPQNNEGRVDAAFELSVSSPG